MFEVSYSEFVAIFQVILIDLILAGDNAIVVGMAAAGVAPEYRKKVILYGIGLAVIMRIIFAGITIQLLNIVGLALVGGLLLLWVCWKLYRDLRLEAEAQVAALDEATVGGDRRARLGRLAARAVLRLGTRRPVVDAQHAGVVGEHGRGQPGELAHPLS